MMKRLEKLLREVWAYLPPPGAAYTFPAPDALWTGKLYGQPFAAVAEDRWHAAGTGRFLAVPDLGGVYVVDLKERTAVNYCAASFPQFMKIMELYQDALKAVPAPESVFDEEGYRRCAKADTPGEGGGRRPRRPGQGQPFLERLDGGIRIRAVNGLRFPLRGGVFAQRKQMYTMGELHKGVLGEASAFGGASEIRR